MAKKLIVGNATVELVDGLNVTFDVDGNVIIVDDVISESSGGPSLIEHLEKMGGDKHVLKINTNKVVDVHKFGNLSALLRNVFSDRVGEVVEFNLRGMSPKVTWSVGNEMGWKLSYSQRPNGNHFIERLM